jgi:lysophospholipase L1-like esterase
MNVVIMRKISLLLSCVALSATVSGAQTAVAASERRLRSYPATSSRIRVMGRHVDDKNSVAFGASGVTFYIKFRGSALEVELENEARDSTSHNWFTVVVDSGEPFRFRADPSTRRYKLVEGLPLGEHTLSLSKATEGQNGHNRLVAVYTQELLTAHALPARRIEFVGNSITSGYGLDQRPVPCGRGAWYDKSHAWLAYGPRIARHLNAEWMLSSVSGIGVVRNWNTPSPVMHDIYRGVYMEYADSLTAWDFRRYTPDLVVIALGTNDFAETGTPPRPALDGEKFVRDYTRFAADVRVHYPRAKLLLLTSAMLSADKNRLLAEYLRRVMRNRAAAGDSAITMYAFSGRYTAGCDGHPDLAEHVRMAEELEPTVKAWMGW